MLREIYKLRVLKNNVLRGIREPKRKKESENAENCT
jgi:hypothetical protein